MRHPLAKRSGAAGAPALRGGVAVTWGGTVIARVIGERPRLRRCPADHTYPLTEPSCPVCRWLEAERPV